MKKKILAAVLAAAMVMSMTGVSAAAKSKEKSEGTTFIYGTTGYSEEMGDAGLNPHDNYSGWSCLRYGVGETLFKYNDNMEIEPWLATDYEFTDDNTVKITLRDGVKFSSGRTMDGEAVKECLDDLIANHDRAPYDMKIDKIEADGMTVTIHTSEPCPALINYSVIRMVLSLIWIMAYRERAALQMWQEQALMLQQRYLQQRLSW